MNSLFSRKDKVVLIGRTNVGKSSIFNRLARKQRTIVHNAPGVTRDYVADFVTEENSLPYVLIDSGGIPFGKQLSALDCKVRDIAFELIDKATVILFVCDGTVSPTEEDEQILQMLRKREINPILLLNKIDNDSRKNFALSEYARFGLQDILLISAAHGHEFLPLKQMIIDRLPERSIDQGEELSTLGELYQGAIFGKPNVGKSSLLNELLNEQRAIVSDVPGTTRDAIAERMILHKTPLTLVDTAGLRRKKTIDEDLETMMAKESLRALKRATIVILVIDGSTGEIADQDLKLLFYAFEHDKGVIVVINKHDLMTAADGERLRHALSGYAHIFPKVPLVYTSCVTKKNVAKLRQEIHYLKERLSMRFDSQEIDGYLKSEIGTRPLFHNRMPVKILGFHAIAKASPTFALDTTQPTWVTPANLAFFEKLLRKKYNLLGCPVRFFVRGPRPSR